MDAEAKTVGICLLAEFYAIGLTLRNSVANWPVAATLRFVFE